MSSSNLYSHPDRLIEEHLIGSSNFTKIFLKEKSENINKKINKISKISKILSLVHDLGKSTSYFQKYILLKEKNVYSKHSLFGAVCSFFLIKELTKKNNDDILPFIAFAVVRRHHGNLKDILNELIDVKDISMLNKQIESIDEKKFNILALKLKDKGLPILLTISKIKEWINNFEKEFDEARKSIRKELKKELIYNYIIFNLIYSILIDCDKTDVVVRNPIYRINKIKIKDDIIDEYKKVKFKESKDIDNIREKAYNESIEKLNNYDLKNNKIFTLTLPTGTGKTLTAFNVAINLKNRLKKESNINSRIIYSLPFLSIIDQNSSVFEEVLKINGIKPTSNIILKHHYLSEMSYKNSENNILNEDMSKILIEGWNSEIIITTFIRVFNSIISNKNRNLRKFHRFSNSILILDEVQSIPIRYWKVIEKVLFEMCSLLNMYIILVTATQPMIFNKDIVYPLVNEEDYFNKLNRILLIPYLDREMGINELYNTFKDKLDSNKNLLFIFNTIKTVKKFYILLKNEGYGKDLTYLSTHIIPKQRLEKINKIKNNIKEGKRKILVTTQLVEAGVDLDFDYVIRDLAPLDCIFQAAGRSNRNNLGKEKGEVYIVKIIDEESKHKHLCYSYIYDSVLINITNRILKNKDKIEEKEFKSIIDNYFREVLDKKSQNHSKNILTAIYKLKYDTEDKDDEIAINKFKLIPKTYPKINVFIQIDKEAKEIWEEYKEIIKIENIFDRKKAFDKIKNIFYQYTISVPEKVDNKPNEEFGFMYCATNDFLKQFYSETGFITELDNFI